MSWASRPILSAFILWMIAVAPGNAQESEKPTTLEAGDVVSVNVFGEESLSGAFEIGPEGEIVFPLLGNLDASGQPTEALAGEVESRLEADYIRDAQVSVAITEEAEAPPNAVTVIGQVESPGQVTFKAETSIDLFTAVASAGGMTERGNADRIELKRRVGDDLRTQFLDLDGDRVFELRDGDTLMVHAMPIVEEEEERVVTVMVLGEVKSPGPVEMNPEQPLDVIGAIASAGGFADTARPSKVVVRRNTEQGVRTFELNVSRMQRDQSEPFMLAPNDTISVPESIF